MLKDKIDEATSILETVATTNSMANPMLLFSGGKDSIVTAHLVKKVLGITRGFCETSLITKDLDLEVRAIADAMGLHITYENNISKEKFARNWFNQVPPKKWKPSDCDKIRHWQSIPKFAKKNNISMMLFGRRLEENTIQNLIISQRNTVGLCKFIRYIIGQERRFLSIRHKKV